MNDQQTTENTQRSPSTRPEGGYRPQGGGGYRGPSRGENRGGPRGGGDRGGDNRGGGRRFSRRRFPRRKVCRFCVEGVVYIDYKNYRLLKDFLTERGKIIPRRITGNSAKHQRMLTTAIKRARYMALISSTGK